MRNAPFDAVIEKLVSFPFLPDFTAEPALILKQRSGNAHSSITASLLENSASMNVSKEAAEIIARDTTGIAYLGMFLPQFIFFLPIVTYINTAGADTVRFS